MDLTQKKWWSYLNQDIRELLLESKLLITEASLWKDRFHDYSFIVFPAAKAYEGFLKKLFLDLGFIDENAYRGKYFRVGKALNPSLDKEIREREGVYDNIVSYCGGEKLAEKLWLTWKNCRNVVFHWFPDEKNAVSFEEASLKVDEVIDAIDSAFEECKVGE